MWYYRDGGEESPIFLEPSNEKGKPVMVARVIHTAGTIYAKLNSITQQYTNLQVEADQIRKKLLHATRNPASYNAATLSNISLMAQKKCRPNPL